MKPEKDLLCNLVILDDEPSPKLDIHDAIWGYMVIPEYDIKRFAGRQWDAEYIDITPSEYPQLTETIIKEA